MKILLDFSKQNKDEELQYHISLPYGFAAQLFSCFHGGSPREIRIGYVDTRQRSGLIPNWQS